MSFETMPHLEMSVEPVVSSRQITYGFILRAIESRIREVMAETLVLPHWDDSPFTSTIGQAFRGGIWANDQPQRPPSDPLTRAAEAGAANEVEREESDHTGALMMRALQMRLRHRLLGTYRTKAHFHRVLPASTVVLSDLPLWPVLMGSRAPHLI